jgi:hypothetical protein
MRPWKCNNWLARGYGVIGLRGYVHVNIGGMYEILTQVFNNLVQKFSIFAEVSIINYPARLRTANRSLDDRCWLKLRETCQEACKNESYSH